jgi:hypothetical protein
MNNFVMRKITLTATYQPLSSVSLIASVDVSALPTNAGVAYFQGDDGTDIPWQPGEWHLFKSIDLSKVMVKGTVSDVVTVVGGTW